MKCQTRGNWLTRLNWSNQGLPAFSHSRRLSSPASYRSVGEGELSARANDVHRVARPSFQPTLMQAVAVMGERRPGRPASCISEISELWASDHFEGRFLLVLSSRRSHPSTRINCEFDRPSSLSRPSTRLPPWHLRRSQPHISCGRTPPWQHARIRAEEDSATLEMDVSECGKMRCLVDSYPMLSHSGEITNWKRSIS